MISQFIFVVAADGLELCDFIAFRSNDESI